MEMNDTPRQDRTWWGTVEFSEGSAKRWEIGPLTLWIRRMAQEWWIAFERDEKKQERMAAALESGDSEWSGHASLERYLTRHAQPVLHISPMLADRPVVTRPAVPLHLCAGEEATVYVSLPAWIRLEAGPYKLVLKEIAIQRLSDTWFGPSTLEGELCYASTTHCRQDLGEVPLYPYRAITPVLIQNRSKQTLVLERLSLPVHFLTVYGSQENTLWTSRVSLRWEHGSTVSMEIEAQAPAQAGKAQILCGPRNEPEKGGVIRAVASFFG
jgi:hypothetical protein